MITPPACEKTNDAKAVLTSELVKEAGRAFGADLVGIGSMDRFDGTPAGHDPRHIFPRAKSIIGLGFRVLRGALRGIEEGTNYYQFMSMGIVSIEEKTAPDTLRRLACFLEDRGYEGAVQRSVPDRKRAEDEKTNPEMPNQLSLEYALSVAPDRPSPDVLPNFMQAAYVCGLGTMGMGGFFLTPEFGPLQRFAFILTDAELEPDPIYSGPALCDTCGDCISACPGNAISKDEKEKLHWAGNTLEVCKTDTWQCAAHYTGANRSINPYMPADALQDFPDREEILSGKKHLSPEEAKKVIEKIHGYYWGQNGYTASICGRACWRACLAHMEQKGTLKKKYHMPFRQEKPWKIDS